MRRRRCGRPGREIRGGRPVRGGRWPVGRRGGDGLMARRRLRPVQTRDGRGRFVVDGRGGCWRLGSLQHGQRNVFRSASACTVPGERAFPVPLLMFANFVRRKRLLARPWIGNFRRFRFFSRVSGCAVVPDGRIIDSKDLNRKTNIVFGTRDSSRSLGIAHAHGRLDRVWVVQQSVLKPI